MSAKILDRLISAFVGAVSAVGTVWFLNANGPDAQSLPSASENAPVKFDRLEVDALRVNEVLFVVDPNTKEPSIELKDGSISAQNNVFAEQIGAFRVLGRKLQATPDDPLNAQSPVFAELATNQDGGAYLALLSPQESHSLTIGFDKTEKGCLVSQNNVDSSMIAQAIFVKPTADGVAASQAETPVAPLEQPLEASPTEQPLEAPPTEQPLEAPPTEQPLEAPPIEQPTQENAPLVPEIAPLPVPADAPQLDAVGPVPGV